MSEAIGVPNSTLSEPMPLGDPFALADFTVFPPAFDGFTLYRLDATFDGDHQVLQPTNSIVVNFVLQDADFGYAFAAHVSGLPTRMSDDPNSDYDGFSPFSISVNGQALVEGFNMAGKGFYREDNVFPIPYSMLVLGANTISFSIDPVIATDFWLYTFGLDCWAGPAIANNLSADLTENPYVLSPGLAFSNPNPRSMNGSSAIAPGTAASLSFTLSDPAASNMDLLVSVAGVAAPLDDVFGLASVSMSLNGKMFAADIAFPLNGGYQPGWVQFRIPAELCSEGIYTFDIANTMTGSQEFLLQSVVVRFAECHQSLGEVSFGTAMPVSQGLTFSSSAATTASTGFLVVSEGTVMTFTFAAPVEPFVLFELSAAAGSGTGPRCPSISINGSVIVSTNSADPASRCFLLPSQLLKSGANVIELDFTNTGGMSISAVRVRSVYRGPALRRLAPNDLAATPLEFAVIRTASALEVITENDELAGAGYYDTALGVLASAKTDLTWLQSAVQKALVKGAVSLAGVEVTPGTPLATSLLAYMAYAIERFEQEWCRLDCLNSGVAMAQPYMMGCQMSTSAAQRLSQVTAISQVGSSFQYSDPETGAVLSFGDMDSANKSRAEYLRLLLDDIVAIGLDAVKIDTMTILTAAYTQQTQGDGRAMVPQGGPVLIVLALALLTVSFWYATRLVSDSQDATNGRIPLNTSGRIKDIGVSYDWENLVGVAYLQPDNSMNVRLDAGSRKDQPLDQPIKENRQYSSEYVLYGNRYIYVYIAGVEHPVRLAPRPYDGDEPFKHSQLAGGEGVSCAGEIQFADGFIRRINTETGHYWKAEGDAGFDTFKNCVSSFIKALQNMGYVIDLDEVSEAGRYMRKH